MFPFSLITIAGLATQVSSIIDFFDERTKKRKKRWRALYEKREGDEYRKAHPTGELLDEMRYLQRISDEEDRISRAYDLTLSLCAFILFWILGALVFHRLEVRLSGCAMDVPRHADTIRLRAGVMALLVTFLVYLVD